MLAQEETLAHPGPNRRPIKLPEEIFLLFLFFLFYCSFMLHLNRRDAQPVVREAHLNVRVLIVTAVRGKVL